MKPVLLLLTCFIITGNLLAQIKGNPKPNAAAKALSVTKRVSKLNPDLQSLLIKFEPATQDEKAAKKPLPLTDVMQNIMQIKGNTVLVDFSIATDVAKAKADLQTLGVKITGSYGRIISAYIPVKALSRIDALASVRYAKPSYKPIHQPVISSKVESNRFHIPGFLKNGPVISQGDTAQLSYKARKQYEIDGSGIKVGILSDSYNNLGTAIKGIHHGELPGPLNPYGYHKNVEVIKDLDSGGSDEGRGMAEIVHDVAPGSPLAFYTAFDGQADFAQGIQTLADNNCKVICDDIFYYAEPFFQDGIIAQSVDSVKERGVAYFSSAGNQSVRSYESEYRSSDVTPFGADYGTAHNFSAPGDAPRYFQPIYIPSGGSAIFSFQWDEPFFSAGGKPSQSDYDIYLTDIYGNIVAGGYSDNIGSGDPVEVFGYYNGTDNYTFFLTIVKYAGPDANYLKYIMYGSSLFYLTDPAIPGILSPTLVGHTKAAGAISTAAAFYLNTPPYGSDTAVAEYFSSEGGVANYFDTGGNRIPALVRRKPEITAPDGGNTSFFPGYDGADIIEDSDSHPNFFGTSAAAPHAAGVAALMLQAHRSPLKPEVVKVVLAATASDMDDANTEGFDKGFDFSTGWGFINAKKAVSKVYVEDCSHSDKLITSVTPVTVETEIHASAQVYPNPFTKSFRVSWSLSGKQTATAELFASDGRRLQAKIISGGKGNTDFTVAGYTAGSYFLKITQGSFSKTIKLIKE